MIKKITYELNRYEIADILKAHFHELHPSLHTGDVKVEILVTEEGFQNFNIVSVVSVKDKL